MGLLGMLSLVPAYTLIGGALLKTSPVSSKAAGLTASATGIALLQVERSLKDVRALNALGLNPEQLLFLEREAEQYKRMTGEEVDFREEILHFEIKANDLSSPLWAGEYLLFRSEAAAFFRWIRLDHQCRGLPLDQLRMFAAGLGFDSEQFGKLNPGEVSPGWWREVSRRRLQDRAFQEAMEQG